MVRWQPDARGRLEAAALHLYRDCGFEQTTVAEIAERAGLTERTFFRYFADKPEVLFSGAAVLEERIVGWLDGHPIAMSLAVIGLDLSEAGACGEPGRLGSLPSDGGCG